MALVTVDSNFINTLIGLIVVLFIVGFGVGIFITRSMMGPAARTIWSARRKRMPLLLHMGRDGLWRLVLARRGFSGLWHGAALEVIPDEKSVHGLIGGAPLAIAHTLSAGTLNPDFLYYSNQFAAAYHKGVEVGENGKRELKQLNPPQVADFMESLLNREAEIKDILTTITRIKNTEISIDEAVARMADERGLAPDDYEGRDKLKNALQGAINTQGKSYEEELKRVENAKKITVEEKGWKIEYDTITTGGGMFGMFRGPKKTIFKVRDLIHHAILNMDDFQHFMPTGSNLDDVWTAIKRSEAAAIKEQQFNPGQAMKWLVVGVCMFMGLLGIYVVISGLHL